MLSFLHKTMVFWFCSLKDIKQRVRSYGYIDYICRSSHRRCSVKKGVLKNFAKFTGKHLCQSLFFNKIANLGLDDSGHLRMTASKKCMICKTNSALL